MSNNSMTNSLANSLPKRIDNLFAAELYDLAVSIEEDSDHCNLDKVYDMFAEFMGDPDIYIKDEAHAKLATLDQTIEQALDFYRPHAMSIFKEAYRRIAMKWIVRFEIIALISEDRPAADIAQDILHLLEKYNTPNDVVLTPDVLHVMKWSGRRILPHFLSLVLPAFRPPVDIVMILGDLWELGYISGQEPGKTITLYRGDCNGTDGLMSGYSFTTDYEVARRYAHYNMMLAQHRTHVRGTPQVFTIKINPKFVIGRNDSRGESEVIILPMFAGGPFELCGTDNV